MRFKTKWSELKTISSGSRLIEGTFVDMAGEEHNATIWEKDKDGKVFPGFETIGSEEFEGELWTKPNDGKKTIYPPKLKASGGTGAGRTAMMEKTMEKKGAMISAAQDKKEEAIQLSSTFRDATLIALAEIQNAGIAEASFDATFKARWEHWRTWLLSNWEPKVPF